MKKLIILLFVSIVFTLNARSQITKGNWMVGGDGSFTANHTYYENNELSSSNGLNMLLSSDMGYFVIDKLTLGLKADFSLHRFTNGTGKNQTVTSLNTGPFIRYYFLPVESIINLFAGSAYEHAFPISYSPPANSYSVFAGLSFFFNSSVAAELLGGFDYSELQGGGTTRTFKMTIGFQIYLKK
ncbi:MAG: hypothetical protein ACRDE2_06130 [Chitinophagaceae bacterium]